MNYMFIGQFNGRLFEGTANRKTYSEKELVIRKKKQKWIKKGIFVSMCRHLKISCNLLVNKSVSPIYFYCFIRENSIICALKNSTLDAIQNRHAILGYIFGQFVLKCFENIGFHVYFIQKIFFWRFISCVYL